MDELPTANCLFSSVWEQNANLKKKNVSQFWAAQGNKHYAQLVIQVYKAKLNTD